MKPNHRKAKLNQICKGKTFEEIKDIVKLKRWELLKHEFEVRAKGYLNKRQGYEKNSKIKISELKKDIAFLLTRMNEIKQKYLGGK